MEIIKAIQQLSNPVLDWIMRIITEGGDIYFFILIGAFLYWIVDKKFAFKLMVSFILSAMINGVIKHFTNKPRPYQEGAQAILQETTGSSMPSGHAQASGALSSMLIYQYDEIKWVKYLAIALMILVPFSRMYLGQHYLEDVLVGSLLGIVLGLFFLWILGLGKENTEDLKAMVVIPLFIVALFFIYNEQFYVAAGGYMGLVFGYFLEKRYVQYEVKEIWWVQLLKFFIGIIGALIIKEGMKPLFALIGDHYIFDLIRYFLVALWASVGAMYVFKALFKRNGQSKFVKQ